MPVIKRSQDAAARGVAAANDPLIVEYLADGSGYVDSFLVSARANAGAPTAAQQNGYTRLVACVGKADAISGQVSAIVANGGQDAYKLGVVVIADVDLSMVYLGGQPPVIPIRHRMESGDGIVIIVTQGIDNAGAAFDVSAGVTINRAPSRFGVTG